MEQQLPQFQGKRMTMRGIPKLPKISNLGFPLHLIFLLEFPEFSVAWLAFRKHNNFWIFRKKISQRTLAIYAVFIV